VDRPTLVWRRRQGLYRAPVRRRLRGIRLQPLNSRACPAGQAPPPPEGTALPRPSRRAFLAGGGLFGAIPDVYDGGGVGFRPGSWTPTPAPLPPHARGRGGTTRGSSASQPPVVFRPYPPWVVGTGSGRVPGPKFAAGTAAGAASGFLGHREGQKPVGFCPLGGAHQSAWSLYIVLGHTPRRRCPAGA
jgi:hypothetical protein